MIKNCDEVTGMALKYADKRARREYLIAPKLGDYYLRVGQLDSTNKTPADVPDKEILSQMNLLRFGLVHGGHLDTLIALWDDLVRETKTIEPIAQHDWRPFRIFVSQTFPSPIFLRRVFVVFNTTLFQALLTHMFRELLSYCVTSIEASGSYSLRLSVLPFETRLFITFWAGNSLHSMCLAVFPGQVFSPAVLISPLSSLFSLINNDVHLLFLGGFTQHLAWTISRVLPQLKKDLFDAKI